MVVNIAYSQETIKELYKFVITIIVINNNNNELASVFYLGSLIDTYWDGQRGWCKTKLIPAAQSIPIAFIFLLFQ